MLEHAGGYSPQDAKRVAEMLLPDVLPYDPRHDAAYPQNGRALTDDVADQFVALFTNGKVTDDKVGPHTDLLTAFPYLGPPQFVSRSCSKIEAKGSIGAGTAGNEPIAVHHRCITTGAFGATPRHRRRQQNRMVEPKLATGRVARRRIRLIGLLRKTPASAGFL